MNDASYVNFLNTGHVVIYVIETAKSSSFVIPQAKIHTVIDNFI